MIEHHGSIPPSSENLPPTHEKIKSEYYRTTLFQWHRIHWTISSQFEDWAPKMRWFGTALVRFAQTGDPPKYHGMVKPLYLLSPVSF